MKKFSIFLLIAIIFLYSAYLFILPRVLNSVKVNSYVEDLIYDKLGVEVKTVNLKLKTNFNLTAQLLADEIDLYKNDKKIFDGDQIDIEISVLKRKINNIKFNNVFIDNSGVQNLFPEHNKPKKKKNIKFSKFPEIYINTAEIYLKDNNNKNTSIIIKNIDTDKGKRDVLSFNAEITSDYLNEIIKISNKKNIFYDANNVYFENLNILFGNTSLFLNGKINSPKKEYSIKINGVNLPIHDIEGSLLYFLKLKNNKKNFMENFTDYSGYADVDLEISNNGVNGTVLMKKLSGKTVLFGVPILFNDFTGYFENDEIDVKAYGKLGYEDVYTDFHLKHYDKERRVITGNVRSVITNQSVSKYIPDGKIEGSVDASVSYKIENALPHVTYNFEVNQGSNIHYKAANLALTEYNRRIFVSTTKYPDKLIIDSYDYSHIYDGAIHKIITGTGLFKEKNNQLYPSTITVKTVNSAPVSLTGDFGKKLIGGTFDGDLKYDFEKNQLTGSFNLSNSSFKKFKIQMASINADEKILDISSSGTFVDSPYNCSLNMDNNFADLIKIHNINLFLDKYIIQDKKAFKHKLKSNTPEIIKKAKKRDYIIENGNIKLNKLIRNKILIENIDINFNLKDYLLNFISKDAYFANGTLKATGNYNFLNHIAIIDFSADDIDSDSVATMVFNLPGQIKGIADANLKAKINTMTRDLSATASYGIKGGYLPKIGSTEFILKKSRHSDKPLKFKLADIINVDISEAKAMASDINGTLNLNNEHINDVNLYSKQKYLSLFVNGDYDIEKEYANVKILGKYNKNARNKIRVLFVPLSLIMKIAFKQEKTMHLYKNEIDKIPNINADPDEIEVFSVGIKGNLNKNDVKVTLRSIK